MTHTESTDVLIIGSGFGGSIAAYHLAAGGAKVVVLERGPWLDADDYDQDFNLGSSSTRIFEFTVGNGMSVLGGNCVGGGSVVYFATMPRAPWYTFERHGSIGRRMWPSTINRASLDPWYDRVEESLPVSQQKWETVPFAGGLWAAACNNAGHTCNPVPAAVDVAKCTNCNWMMSGCKFDAKRSLLLNYLPGALAHGAQIRPLHEVQKITRDAPDGGYRVHYNTLDDVDYRIQTGGGAIDAKIVIVAAGTAATPVILQRSEADLGPMPHAVGRYFSGNGERLNTAILNEDRVRDVLGLARPDGVPYEGYQIGKGPCVATWDQLDGALPEYSRFSLEQLYFPPG
ncbi:MAG: FAD-dependent oxidoreductase, partial [Jatrophihabitantaceae bacterium]